MNEPNEKKSKMIELCGLWPAKNNKFILTGKLGSVRIVVMENQYKYKVGSPTHKVFISPIEYVKKDSQSQDSLKTSANTQSQSFLDEEDLPLEYGGRS